MKHKVKVTAVWWAEFDVDAGYRQPFDNFKDELAEAAIDMMIDKIQRFEPDDIEWETEIMEDNQ